MLQKYQEKAEKILGFPGHLISWSKSGYRKFNPTHLVIFNSNICIEEGKIWYGDLDITVSHKFLLKLAEKLNKVIYVLYEMDGRFENETKPKIENHVIRISPQGNFIIGDKYKEYFQLNENFENVKFT